MIYLMATSWRYIISEWSLGFSLDEKDSKTLRVTFGSLYWSFQTTPVLRHCFSLSRFSAWQSQRCYPTVQRSAENRRKWCRRFVRQSGSTHTEWNVWWRYENAFFNLFFSCSIHQCFSFIRFTADIYDSDLRWGHLWRFSFWWFVCSLTNQNTSYFGRRRRQSSSYTCGWHVLQVWIARVAV